jgi:hypothetical protein
MHLPAQADIYNSQKIAKHGHAKDIRQTGNTKRSSILK